eukprot:TRINITY_DN43179_c0_g1_i2.p1 TRINITY_DN43179_c0_g1~~TRINITY_DN43179_c0_g1_i2.p1  ORF type:complete len:345 (+),score=71.60 TRINITY_DN43179_c0_g1_i2:78-1112(+)
MGAPQKAGAESTGGGSSGGGLLGGVRRLWRRATRAEDDDGLDAHGLTPEQRTKFEQGLPLLLKRGRELAGKREWPAAAADFEKAARLCVLVGDRRQAADHFKSAANCFANAADGASGAEAAPLRQQHWESHDALWERGMDEAGCGGHHQVVATMATELARCLRKRGGEAAVRRAGELLSQAAEHHAAAGANATACALCDELADAAQDRGAWSEAAEHWKLSAVYCMEETAAHACVSSVLCRAAAWPVGTEDEAEAERELGQWLEALEDLDPLFRPPRKEHLLCTAVVDAVVAGDVAAAEKALATHTATRGQCTTRDKAILRAARRQQPTAAGGGVGGLLKRVFR